MLIANVNTTTVIPISSFDEYKITLVEGQDEIHKTQIRKSKYRGKKQCKKIFGTRCYRGYTLFVTETGK